MYGNGTAVPSANWTQPAGGYVTEANTPVVSPASDRIHGDLEGAIGRVHNAIERVRSFADAHVGGRGANAGQPKDTQSRAGKMGAIQDRVDQLHMSLLVLEDEIERLSQI